MAAEIEEERLVGEPLRDLLDRMVAVEELVDLLGQVVDLVEDERELAGRHRPADLRQLQRDEVQQRHLRGEGLRGGDADLEPAARVEDRVDLARDLRAHHVRDRDGAGALLAGELHRLDRVARLAGLRDPDHERVLVDHRVAVDPLGGDVRLDRDPRPLLDHVAADDARVVGGAAGEDDDPAQLLELLLGVTEPLEHERAVANAVADRLGDGLGLLVDLLEHERLVAALLGAFVVPVELDRIVLDPGAVDAREDRAFGRDRDDVAVVGELHLARLLQEGGRVRGEEHLAAADPDHERRLVPRGDEHVGVIVMDDDEGEVALELGERAPDRLGEIALVVALDQVRDGLRVGLGAERVSLRDQALAELAVVLDDPVQDDRHLRAVAAGQRVRVRLGDAAVRRPARVAEPVVGLGAVRARRLLQVLEVADRADVLEPVSLAERDPGGVVAAVLESLEALEQQLLALSRPDVSDDPAHASPPSPTLIRNASENAEEPGAPPASSRASRAPSSRGLRS